MTARFSFRYPVRHHDLDWSHHVGGAVFVQYLQQAAIDAAEAAGFGVSWCRGRGAGWVIRRLTLRYLAPVRYPDELLVTTWISQVKGARCWRESELRRASDGRLVVRARAEWVLLDRASGAPQRIPADAAHGFAPAGAQDDLRVRPPRARPFPHAPEYHTHRRVQAHELDTAVHVNHATYLHWIAQAQLDALAACGRPADFSSSSPWSLRPLAHDLEYLAPAEPNAPVEVLTRLAGRTRLRLAWTHEVRHAGTAQLLARDHALTLFCSPAARPLAPPPDVLASLLRGPHPPTVPDRA